MPADPSFQIETPAAAAPRRPGVVPVLSIALPAYNEEITLEPIVLEAMAVAEKLGDDYEILIVDDGSTDATPQVAARLAERYDEVRVHTHPVNRGFAGAMRSCFVEASGEYVVLAASDGQSPMEDVPLFWALRDRYDLIFSLRLERSDSPRRRASSGLWYLFLRFLLAFPIPEFSSLFLLRRDQIPELAVPVREDGANYLPLLYMTAMKTGRRVGVLGVLEKPRQGGVAMGFQPSLIARTIAEDFKIWWRLRIRPR
jgi:glycosyltransferase involved in cell wall biosynthesis